eukprot:c12918_g1_i3.p1 GENE.c12918_g1_i3~~c12918_g1_i3.p1  ORF type:complete len:343 (+),score=86.22 c12918_g1_i3:76-1029(+)
MSRYSNTRNKWHTNTRTTQPKHGCDHLMMHVVLATEIDNQVHLLLSEKSYTLAFKDLMKRPFLFGSSLKGQQNLERVLGSCNTQELEDISRITTGKEMEELSRKFLESLEEKKDSRDDPANSSTSRATSEHWDELASEAPDRAQNMLQRDDHKDPTRFSFPRAFVKDTEDPTSSDNAIKAINRFLKPGQQDKVKFFDSKQRRVQVMCNIGGYYPEEAKSSVFHFAFASRDALILVNPDNVTRLKTFPVQACLTSNEVSPEVRLIATREQAFLDQCADNNTTTTSEQPPPVTSSTNSDDVPDSLFASLRISGREESVD